MSEQRSRAFRALTLPQAACRVDREASLQGYFRAEFLFRAIFYYFTDPASEMEVPSY